MAGEIQTTGLAIYLKHGDVVATLIATIEKLTCRIEVEAARIIPSRPFFASERQVAVWAHRKDPDAVVQPVARIDESSVG